MKPTPPRNAVKPLAGPIMSGISSCGRVGSTTNSCQLTADGCSCEHTMSTVALPRTNRMTDTAYPPRVVLAKVGLDGHDRGIKVVARGLRDAGLHVIYAGLWQTPEAVVRTVAEEDADWLGLSLLSGAHLTLVPRVLGLLRQGGLGDVGVMVGGIIPEADVPN